MGYELADNLDFDTNRNGRAGVGDTYWNGGKGWEPFESDTTFGGFRAIFEGNGHTIANLFIDRDSDDVGLFGRTVFSVIRHVGLIDVEVSGSSNVGGLAGADQGSIIGSYVTGMVTGTGREVGGLVGSNWGGPIVASYAAVEVTGGTNVGGLIGENQAVLTASYATGRVTGDDNVGGLVGSIPRNGTTITASYATGTVTGESNVGGLVGEDRTLSSTDPVIASYWDTTTSRQTTSAGGQGRTTAQLQAPTGYSGIYYAQWNVDLDGDGTNDDPWDFGMDDEYPVLAVNFDGTGDTTWEEFGYQLRAGPPNLTATSGPTEVTLEWDAVTTDHWDPEPDVTYTVIRDDGSMVEVIDEALSGTTATDTAVPAGMPSYQVAAVVNGGEATRSGPVTVTAPNQKPTFPSTEDGMRTVAENTRARVNIGLPVSATDPENNRLTYSLDGTDADDFGINTSTGQLQTKAALDHEDKASYSVTVSVHDGKATDHMADDTIDDTIRVTITVTDVNEPPVVSGLTSVEDYVENSTGAVATYTATDPEERLVRWSVSDPTAFAITTDGVLTFRSPPDYESQRRYTVTVTATDPGGRSDSVTVGISITNIDEAGSVTLAGLPPRERHQLTASLSDLDGGLRGIAWQWARSVSSASPWTEIDRATSMRYMPEMDDVGQYLRASAIYTDGQGSGKRASQATTTSVQAAPRVTLHLSDTSISEDGTESSMVTATLDPASSVVTTVTVSAPTSDVALSSNRTLTITAGERESTGEVTLTAKDNNVDGPERKTVQVGGMTNNSLVADPDPVNLTIEDDDPAPVVEFILSPQQISENNQVSTVTARLMHPSVANTMMTSVAETTVMVSAAPVGPAVPGDFTLSTNRILTIAAGAPASSGTAVTLTSVNNETDAPNKQVTVTRDGEQYPGLHGSG